MKNQLLLSLAFFVAVPTTAFPADGPGSGKLPSSFQFLFSGTPKGLRYWTRASENSWVERSDDVQRAAFNAVGLVQNELVNNCDGVLTLKEDKTLQVFVPDDRCARQIVLLRFVGPSGPTSSWLELGAMEQVKY